MRISDWSSDVCSSDLWEIVPGHRVPDQGTLCVAATDFSKALDRERCGVFHALGDEVEMMLRWPKRVAVCSSPRGQRCLLRGPKSDSKLGDDPPPPSRSPRTRSRRGATVRPSG